ncbi:MAG: response regulator [Elusimicrobia bacterium]|nr:response regulator [Elusimicrobiota bacterium]
MDVPPRTLNILLVDDSEDDVLLAKAVFSRLAFPHNLATLSNAAAALDYLRCAGSYSGRKPVPPDLLLLDINMPGMDGFSLLREIKADQRLRKIPVIMLTTSSSATDIRRSYEHGAASFLTKPANFEGFREMMRRVGKYWTSVSALP